MKLKTRFYLLFFLCTLLVLGTVQITSFYRARQVLYQRLEERGLAITRSLCLTALDSFVINSFSGLGFYIDEMTKDTDIEYVIVTDPYGKIILHTDSSEDSQVLYDPVSIRATRAKELIHQIYTVEGRKVYEVSSPVQFGSVHWGIARVGFNLNALTENLRRTIWFFIMLTLGVITVVSLIFLFVGDKITQPIERLIEASQEISRGNLAITIPVKSKDEVGRLSRAFNQMARTLKGEKEKIEKANRNSAFYNEKLKKKVDDLSALNKATKALRSSLSPEKELNLILHIAMGISQAKRGSFFSFSDIEETLLLKAKRGSNLNLELVTQLARRAVKSRVPVARVNRREVEVDINFPSLGEEENTTIFAYPLMTKNAAWGVVVLDLPEKSFTFDEFQMVSTFLEEANLIIKNSFLMEVMLESRQIDSFNRLVSIILHDLRGTVAYLSLSLQNARKYYYDPQFREDLLAIISATAKSIQFLTEKISKSPTLQEPKPHSINQILKEIVDELRLRESQNITLKEKYGNIPLLVLDGPSIKRVFRNMLVNALEAMSQGGTVEINSYLESSCSCVCVEIRDTGVGMTESFINSHLFRPFISTKEKGLGVALYYAQEIVYLHGGKIGVESKLGKGTKFRVKLPLFSQNLREVMIRKRLGQYLLDMGVITEEKLRKAMQVQATDKRKMGQILIDMGYIRESEMEKALEKQKEAEVKMVELVMRKRL